MNHQGEKRLLSFDFIGLCLVIFLAYCNTTVFYSLDIHLGRLGIAQDWRGFLIGSSSLATIAAYLALSPRMTSRNAVRNACLGAVLLMACGFAYLHATDRVDLLAVRLASGLAVYLVTAAVMTLLVERIPPERSGQAFGLFSVSILLPYSIVPAAFDAFAGPRASLPDEYMAMSLFLAPAIVVLLAIGRRQRRKPPAPANHAPSAISFRDMALNAIKPDIGIMLALYALYVMTFSAVFYLAKGYFLTLGIQNVGSFFSIQMACMIVIRLLGNHLFDRFPKTRQMYACFGLTALSCVLAALAEGQTGMCLSAVVMGTGMGMGSPAMNGLMFCISEPRFKAVNSNLMTMAQHLGNFLGPMLGAVAVGRLGYTGFLILGAAACVLALALCVCFAAKGLDRGDPARERRKKQDCLSH